MTVYDDMYRYPIGRFGRMKMSHLVADTTDELLAMVDRIGLDRRWIQKPGTPDEHFDLSMSMRKRAIAAGARPHALYNDYRDRLLYRTRDGLVPIIEFRVKRKPS